MAKGVVIFCLEIMALLLPAVSTDAACFHGFLAALAARVDAKRSRFSPAWSPSPLTGAGESHLDIRSTETVRTSPSMPDQRQFP